jgi:hypothetical protein
MLKYHIQTIEVGSGGANAISFNSIPQDFDDLYITLSLRFNPSSVIDNTIMRFNQTTSNYFYRVLRGTGSSRETYTGSTNFLFLGETNGANSTSNTFANQSVYVSNYKANVSKSVSIDSVMENNATTAYQNIIAGLWSNTSPITSIDVKSVSDFGIIAGSTISLYGVRRGADGVTLPAAIGGTVTTSGGYTIHTFNTSGTFTAFRPLECEYLVVAGGGGGGRLGGGGGAGGYLTGTTSVTSGTNYTVTVGSGGTGSNSRAVDGVSGTSSVFSAISTSGGGGGGSNNRVGSNGGSGGGGAEGAAGGTGVSGQGFAGGAGAAVNWLGGGGGASQTGFPGVISVKGGDGGAGLSSAITGTSITRSGGGGGGAESGTPAGSGGAGGGGAGGAGNNNGVAGTANTGGGGGGARDQAATGGNGANGGSGVVIIRYLTP